MVLPCFPTPRPRQRGRGVERPLAWIEPLSDIEHLCPNTDVFYFQKVE